MSSDAQILAAFAMRAGVDLRYFELVTFVNGTEQRKCFLCLGKHGLYFIRTDLGGMIHEGGRIFYSNVLKVFQDRGTRRHMLLVLGDNRPPEWKSDRLFLQSDSREVLLKHLRCLWQTDSMWRLGKAEPLPLFAHNVTKASAMKEDPLVEPFRGFSWQSHNGYRMMVPYAYVPQANAIQAAGTGEYVDPHGNTLVLHVHEVLTLGQLTALERDNIRWVAQEYKSQLTKDDAQFYVLRNAPCQKRMNLTGDIAAWYAWELIIRTRAATVVCILLRRQYIPPVCCSAQDMALILRMPSDEHGEAQEFHYLLQLARLVADSVCTDAPDMGVYREIVQAKLDALRFDEEGFEWVAAHLKLRPKWHREAKIFLRSLIRIFVDDGALPCCTLLLDAEAPMVLANAEPDEEWKELESEEVKDLRQFIVKHLQDPEGEQIQRPDFTTTVNRWHARIARYLAWAVDGGLLGAKFNFDMFFANLGSLTEAAMKSASYSLYFMLHMRTKDMLKPWSEVNLLNWVDLSPPISEWQLNDRVMCSLMGSDYLRKEYGCTKEEEYFQCLARLLEHIGSSNFKAYICRLFIEAKASSESTMPHQASLILVKPLVGVLKGGSVFLATYAAAALVNLSSDNDSVKQLFFGVYRGIANTVTERLKVKDDDLLCYTLMLIANLTKESHTCSVLASYGVIPILSDILTSSYQQCVRPIQKHSQQGGREIDQRARDKARRGNLVSSEIKDKILAQVCIVMGQYCNHGSGSYREMLTTTHPHTVKCVIFVYANCRPGSTLACRTLFCLKQLSYNVGLTKTEVGKHVIEKLVKEELAAPDTGDNKLEKTSDFISQAIMLLQMLAGMHTNCVLMDKVDTKSVLDKVQAHRNAAKLPDLPQRIEALKQTIDRYVNLAHLQVPG